MILCVVDYLLGAVATGAAADQAAVAERKP